MINWWAIIGICFLLWVIYVAVQSWLDNRDDRIKQDVKTECKAQTEQLKKEYEDKIRSLQVQLCPHKGKCSPLISLTIQEKIAQKKAELSAVQAEIANNQQEINQLKYKQEIIRDYELAVSHYEALEKEIDSLTETEKRLSVRNRELQDAISATESRLALVRDVYKTEQEQLEKTRITINVNQHIINANKEKLRILEQGEQIYNQKIRKIDKLDADIREKQRMLDSLQVDLSYARREHRELIEKEKTRVETELEHRFEEKLQQLKDDMLQCDDVPAAISQLAKAWTEAKAEVWDKTVVYLLNKPHPISIATALEYRQQFRFFKEDVLGKYKETQYKYDYLLSLFPDLAEYIDGDAVQEAATQDATDYEDQREGDLSREEWLRLSETEKSQLALDRYNERRRLSNAQVGRDYEEYVAYQFRERCKGAHIDMYGEQKGLEDLGRDLIVTHRDKTYIVQCKRWSQDKLIREKHVMQLYGSTIEYCWQQHRAGLDVHGIVGKSVIPVFVTTTQFSETAKRFAKVLGVVVAQLPMGEYPQIKCNIGRDGRRIYHLPFDQQYNSTIIEHDKGEFMAWTVNEAEDHGFERAKRHIII